MTGCGHSGPDAAASRTPGQGAVGWGGMKRLAPPVEAP